jgi:hypothetical protein
MSGKRREDVHEKDIQSLKYFDKLLPLLERLHEVGCQRDKAGNRELHFDQYCMMVLLFLFNPVVRSLRAIQQASELKKVQKKLGCGRLRWLAQRSHRRFEPERLKEIIAELGMQLEPVGRDPLLKDVRHTIPSWTARCLKGLPLLMQAAAEDPRAAKYKAKWRLHFQFEVERYIPRRSSDCGRGRKADERAVSNGMIEPGRCYVKDRGYAKFTLFNAIHGETAITSAAYATTAICRFSKSVR